MHKANLKFFLKIFTSYILLYALPVILIITATYGYIFNIYSKNITSLNQAILNNAQNTVLENIKTINILNSRLALDVSIRKYASTVNVNSSDYVLMSHDVSKALAAYCSTVNFGLVGVYFHNNDNIITANAIYSSEEYYNIFLADLNIPYKDWHHRIMTVNFPEFISSDIDFSKEALSLYCSNIFPGEKQYMNATLIVILDTSHILKDFNNQTENRHFLLMTSDKKPIIYSKNLPDFFTPSMILTDHETFIFECNKKRYYSTIDATSSSGLIAVSFVEYDQVFKPIIKAKTILFLLIFISFLLCIILSYITSYLTIKPALFVVNLMSKENNKNYISNFDDIKQLIEDILNSNQNLRLSLQNQHNVLSSLFFEILLNNSMALAPEHIQDLLSNFNIKFKYNKYQAVILDGLKGDLQDLLLVSTIRSCLTLSNFTYFIIPTYKKQKILIINHCLNVDEIVNCFKRLHNILSKKHKMKECKIGIGRVIKHLTEFTNSYNDAVYGLNNIRETNDFVCYMNTSENLFEDINFYNDNKKNTLITAIKSGNVSLVAKILDEIRMVLESNKSFSENTLNYLRYCLIATCYEIIKTNYIKDSTLKEQCIAICKLNSGIKDYKKSFTQLFGVLIKITKHIENNKLSSNKNLINDIKNYIAENFSNSDMSLQLIADKFNLSYNYLSSFFKEQTGENFVNFLHKVRVEEACRLLKKNMTINNIAKSVGYTNVNTFIRVFKNIYNITPNEYKKHYVNIQE